MDFLAIEYEREQKVVGKRGGPIKKGFLSNEGWVPFLKTIKDRSRYAPRGWGLTEWDREPSIRRLEGGCNL